MRLILKLFIGIFIGIMIGNFADEFTIRLFLTFKTIFGSFLGFIIPLIIVFFIVSGMANLDVKAGRLLLIASGMAYISTIIAGLLAYFAAANVVPFIATAADLGQFDVLTLTPFFTLTLDPVLSVTSALAIAFIFGISIATCEQHLLKRIFDEGKITIEQIILKIVIPWLPVYVSSIFVELAQQDTVTSTIAVFGFVLLLAILLHWVMLLFQYTVASVATGRNPIKAMVTMLPAYFTAIGTMSSAATIPVTLKQVKKNGVHNDIANFTVPLFASIHISGSTITITACAIAVMSLSTDLVIPGFADFMPFLLVMGVIMVAAPAIPGGGVMVVLGILSSMLGFNEAALGLMIALYIAQDSLGTATNVTGDGALAIVIDKIAGRD